MTRAFSKIIILVILVILAGGGIFAWQYFGAPKEITDWKTYKNEEFGFEIKYPHNSTNVKYDVDSFEAFLPFDPDTRLSEKVFTINVKEEEYDQPIEYYCAQGLPHASITTFNDIDFCKSETSEEVKEDLVVRRFTYHTIHNKRWITSSLRLSSCIPRSPGDACSVLAEFNESKEKEIFNQMLFTFKLVKLAETEKPYIKVISPNGGERYMGGRTYEIKWESKGIEKIDILYNVAKGWLVVNDYPAETGKYSWTPDGIVEQYSSFVGEVLSQIDIKITIFERKTDGTIGIQDSSDNYFTIVSPDETADWKTYQWNNLEFKYPQTWTVEKIYYQTPVQQIKGEPSENIGLKIFPETESIGNDFISIGGHQVSCDPSENHTKCQLISSISNFVYTDSNNPDILKVFDKILSTFRFLE